MTPFLIELPDDERDVIRALGEKLYGTGWQTHMAKAIGIPQSVLSVVAGGGEKRREMSPEMRRKVVNYLGLEHLKEIERHNERMMVIAAANLKFHTVK